MKRFLLSLGFLLGVLCASAQIAEPEYIGQAYALLQNGERVALSSEIGYVSLDSKSKHRTFSHSYTSATTSSASDMTIWRQLGWLSPAHATINSTASSSATINGFAISTTREKSVNYLNISGVASLAKLRVREPFTIILRLESNEYLSETQMKVVRFVSDDGVRRAHAGSGVPFRAVKVGKSSYQITLDKPFYGEYGVVFKNDMNTILTFSLGYSDDEVRSYVKPFLEPGSVEMIRYTSANSFDIFDVDKGEYVEDSEFAANYGWGFLNRIEAEYSQQKKALAKANKAFKKAQRKAMRVQTKN